MSASDLANADLSVKREGNLSYEKTFRDHATSKLKTL
jgi:hypothetical protein